MNDELRRGLVPLLLTLCSLTLHAQSAYLSIQEIEEKTSSTPSSGGAGGCAWAVFESANDHLAINSSLDSDPQQPKPEKSGKVYRYEMKIDLSKVRDRVFTVAVRGTANQDQIKKVFRPNQKVLFRVTEVENPIVLENQSTGSDAYLVSGKACIEFTTPIDNVQVDHDKRLKALLTRTKNASGANLLSLEIDIPTLRALRDKQAAANQAYEDYEKELDANKGEFTSAMAEKEKQLEAARDEAEVILMEATTIRVWADGTNVRTVPQEVVQSLSAKQKVPYAILPMKQEAEVITRTSYDQFMLNANESFKVRKYAEAARIYQEAADAPDATQAQRDIARNKKENMEQYAAFKHTAYEQVKLLNSYKKSGERVSYDVVEDCYEAAIKNFTNLRNLTNDSYYDTMIAKLKDGRDNLGSVIQGRVVYAKYNGGKMEERNLTNGGVVIYGVTTKNEKMAKKGGYGDRLGEVEPNGAFHIQVNRSKYAFLLFLPVEDNDSDIKNPKFLPLEKAGHTALRVEMN